MKFSNTKLDTHERCGHYYKIQYIEGYDADITHSSLIFGRAVDQALNYLLECKRDSLTPDLSKAKEILLIELNKWSGQNMLDYFKNEMPEDLTEEELANPMMLQVRVWMHLVDLGNQMLQIYHDEILPKLKRVISVQMAKSIENGEGDTFQLIADFMAEYEDGRIVLFDNKTASKKYAKNSVVTSRQLSLYSEYFDNKYCGYIVMLKKPTLKGERYQIVIDEIPEEQMQKAFDELETRIKLIKQGEFERNHKACFMYGKPCKYMNACKKNDYTGLILKKGYKGHGPEGSGQLGNE